MEFTQEDKDKYLDKLARLTQEGMWTTEMSIMKSKSNLAKKKALLDELKQKLENKEFESARDGKNQIKFTEDRIAKLENDIKEGEMIIQTGRDDLILIEDFRKIPV